MSDYIITFIASFLIWVMFAGLLVLWIIDGRIKKEQAMHAFIGSVVVWILAVMIKTLYPTLRPYYISGTEPLTLVPPTDSAFPSIHTAVAFTIAFIVWLHDRKLGNLFIIMAFFVGLGRVLAHVHYPVDVFGGAIFGILAAFAMENLHVFSLIKNLSNRNNKK